MGTRGRTKGVATGAEARTRIASGTGAWPWTTPDELLGRVERLWERGELLRAFAVSPDSPRAEAMFPLRLPLRAPTSRDLLDRFDDVRRWIEVLKDGSAEARGFGYELEWDEVNHRQLGANRLPRRAILPTPSDGIRLIGRQSDARRFGELRVHTVAEFPVLEPWLKERPLLALEHHDVWPAVLSVLRWFRAHGRSGAYLRQVDAQGVDTKFIERHKAVLAELLDRVLEPGNIASEAAGAAEFETRYGLRKRPVLLRVRVLDPSLAVAGLTDLSAPVEQIAALDLRPERVFVTENDTNALAFPDVAGSLVVFGKGYALDVLDEVPWLHRAEVQYWGDIDTHGFAILDRFRAAFPRARSLLMDERTLLAHRHAWTQEAPDARCDRTLGRLAPEEQRLYDSLREDRIAPALRLEQERIGFRYVCAALEALAE